MTPSGRPDIPDWCARAGEASRAVTRPLRPAAVFPAGHASRPDGPARGPAGTTYRSVALLVAGALSGLPAGRRPPGPGDRHRSRLAPRLLAGIRLRNLLTVVNDYYDDMGWLALATLRLDRRTADTGSADGRGRHRAHRRNPAHPRPAARFGLHRRPGRRNVLEHAAGLQKHRSHGPGRPLLRPDGPPRRSPGPAGLARCPALRSGPGPVPGRAADLGRRGRVGAKRPSTATTRARSSAPCWSSAAQPT